MKYLSAFNYGYDLLLINQWDNVTSIMCEYPIPEDLCRTNGPEVLEFMKLDFVRLKISFPKKYFLLMIYVSGRQ